MIKSPEKYKLKVFEYNQKYACYDCSRKVSDASTKADFDEND